MELAGSSGTFRSGFRNLPSPNNPRSSSCVSDILAFVSPSQGPHPVQVHPSSHPDARTFPMASFLHLIQDSQAFMTSATPHRFPGRSPAPPSAGTHAGGNSPSQDFFRSNIADETCQPSTALYREWLGLATLRINRPGVQSWNAGPAVGRAGDSGQSNSACQGTCEVTQRQSEVFPCGAWAGGWALGLVWRADIRRAHISCVSIVLS